MRDGPADEVPGNVVYLWPCNVQAWRCWCAVQSQWRHGFNGATGLDYAAVLAVLRASFGLGGRRLRTVIAALQAAERAVLEVWAEQRADQRG